MKQELRGRKGFSLVELLIAVVVLGILSALMVNSGASAQRKARFTTAMTVLEDYETAFSTVCLSNPGVMKDREEAWGDGSAYTTVGAMTRIVNLMNASLDPAYQLVLDSTGSRFESQGEDPWGGKFVVTEFPLVNNTASGYDPTEAGSVAQSAMRLAIWATGNDGSVESKVVTDDSVGIALEYRNGFVQSYLQGVENHYPFSKSGSPEGSDYILRF